MNRSVCGWILWGSVLLSACAAPEPPLAGEVPSGASVAGGTAATAVALSGAAAVPAGVDTAGLGARISTAFPGWRLSTEAEIGARFPLLDGSTPQESWEEWGSGRAWWVWDGDFDGDGTRDMLAILSNAADPSEDKLVVLHGNGTHADLGGLGGWGVGITRKGEELRGTVLQSDAIATVYWEKGADVVLWNPATRTYEPLESDCC